MESPGSSLASRFALILQRDFRLTVMLVLTVLGMGLAALLQIPQMEDPALSQRSLIVTTLLPGADAAQVEAKVTDKIEEKLLEIPELKKLRSQSRAGSSWISFEVKDSVRDTDGVWSRVRGKVQEARANLPSEASEPVTDDMRVGAYAYLGAVVWEAPGPVDRNLLRRLALQLAETLRTVAGTDSTDLFGDPSEEIAVRLDPLKASAVGLDVHEVAESLRQANTQQAAGMLHADNYETSVRVNHDFRSLDDVANSVIRQNSNGDLLLLKDVAVINREVRKPALSEVIVNGQPAVVVGSYMSPQCSIARWNREVQQRLQQFEAGLPEPVRLLPLLVQNRYVGSRMRSLLGNLILGTLAVGLITVFFMGYRAACLVTLTLPINASIVLSGMVFLNIPLHQMSVTGLVISLGLMIDNAIIITDELELLLRSKVNQRIALTTTLRRFTAPLVGSTLTTVLAFCPLAFLSGPTGEFVGSIGMTVILSVCSSLVIALTILPAMASRFLEPVPRLRSQPAWLANWHRGYKSPQLEKRYRLGLMWLLEHPWRGIALGAALPLCGGLLFGLLPQQFFPLADRDQFHIELETSASTSLASTRRLASQIEGVVRETLDCTNVSWYVGQSSPAFYYNQIPSRKNTPSFAQGIVQVSGRFASRRELKRLQAKLNEQFPMARATVRQFEQGPPLNAPIEIRIFGQDIDQLHMLGNQVRARLASVKGIEHIRTDLGEVRPVAGLRLDPMRLRAAALSESDVQSQLFSQLEGLQAGNLLEQNQCLPVRIFSAQATHSAERQLSNLNVLVGNPAGADSQRPLTPLDALGTIELAPKRSSITRMDGQRVNEIMAYVGNGVLPANVLQAFQNQLEIDPINLPGGCRIEYGGDNAERKIAVRNLLSRTPFIALAVIACLVLALGSVRMVALVCLVAIMSMGLGIGTLCLTGLPFGFMAIIGMMGLMGVAINDSIVVLSTLRAADHSRTGDLAAIVDTVVGCSRHVLSTTLTTMFGFLPLILEGGQFWPPLAVVIGFGVGGATMIALTFLPCAYLLLFKQVPQPMPCNDASDLADQIAKEVSELKQVLADRKPSPVRQSQ